MAVSIPSGTAWASDVARHGANLLISEADQSYPGPNRITLAADGNDYVITDAGTDAFLVAGPGCRTTANVRTVRCAGHEGDRFFVIPGSGDDHVVIDADVGVTVCAGPGDDHFEGGPGDDTFYGGDGDDSAAGIGGQDHLVGDGSCGRVLDASEGTPGRNVLDGGDDFDIVVGGEGGDVLRGGGDQDVLLGDGEGGDVSSGGPDVLSGGGGSDELIGQFGDDVLDGGADGDELSGSDGEDRLFGGEGDDILGLAVAFEGSPYSEERGNDRLDGGLGNDELVGGPGSFVRNVASDFLRVEPVRAFDSGAPNGTDVLVGGSGTDTASYVNRASPQSLSLDGQANDGSQGEGDAIEGDVERLVGGLAADSLEGGDGDEELDGGAGEDVLFGGAGADSLSGGIGDARDRLKGGLGPDLILGGGGDDDVYGEAGDDRLLGGGGEDYLEGGPGKDGFDGGKGGDFLLARDGVADQSVDCGPKVDFGLADASDKLAQCEGSDRSGADRPLVGKSVAIRRLRGAPLFRLPETERFFPLPLQLDAPVGSALDAGAPGSLAMLTVAGRTQVSSSGRRRAPTAWAVVSGGRLRMTQSKPRRATADLFLEGGDFAGCETHSAGAVGSKTVRGMTVRSEGRFRARGRNSVTVGRNAVWVVEDRCDGTQTRTLQGTSVVSTGGKHKVVVRQGSRYVAKPQARSGGGRGRQ